jgi:hypothetical protein
MKKDQINRFRKGLISGYFFQINTMMGPNKGTVRANRIPAKYWEEYWSETPDPPGSPWIKVK